MIKIKNWYNSLSNKKRLLVHFIIQLLYWYFSMAILNHFIWPANEPKPIPEQIFIAIWVALWMTIIFQWRTVKVLFKRTNAEK